MTLLGAALDTVSGHISFISAGHSPPMIVSKTSQFLPCSGIPSLKQEFNGWTIRDYNLRVGDIILMYTDGLVENQGGTAKLFDWISFESHSPMKV